MPHRLLVENLCGGCLALLSTFLLLFPAEGPLHTSPCRTCTLIAYGVGLCVGHITEKERRCWRESSAGHISCLQIESDKQARRAFS